MKRPSLLILSFSRIFRDARVLKQVNLFKDEFRVTTCGYGHAPCEGVEHIEIPMDKGMWNLSGRLITLKQYGQVYWRLDGVKWVWNELRGRKFDVVLADDYNAVPIGVRLHPRGGVHADLHEYSPSEGEHDPAWNRRIRPWREWLIKRYAAKAESSTTVCQSIADEYRSEFGLKPGVVHNAAPYADLLPTPPHSPLRLVYHGNAQPDRGLAWMAQAISASSNDVTFDLYLPNIVDGGPEDLREVARADQRIRIHEGVPYSELIPMLNEFDVGVYVLRPLTFNLRYALPNKIFDFVQARLGIITGPSPEMARLVHENDLGVVLPDFSAGSLTRAIDQLTKEDVAEWKASANEAAYTLSAEEQNQGWEQPIRALGARAAQR